MPLLYTVAEWKKQRSQINARGIRDVQPGQECYVDLRAWGWDYYESIGLPDMVWKTYVVLCKYVKWTNSKKTKIDVRCELFGQFFEWTSVDVQAYGLKMDLEDMMILVDGEFSREYPKLLEG